MSPFTVARVARVVRVVHVARVVRIDVVSILFVILVVAHVAHQVGSLEDEDETFIQAAILSPEQEPGLLGGFKRKDREVMLKRYSRNHRQQFYSLHQKAVANCST